MRQMDLAKKLLRNRTALMFLRYVTVGGGIFLIDLGCFMLMIRQAGFSPEVAQACSRTIGAAVGFFGHKYFSFAQSTGDDQLPRSTVGQIAGYIAILVVGILLSPIVIWGMLQIVHSHLVLAKIFTEAVMVCLNFVLMKALFARFLKRHAQTI